LRECRAGAYEHTQQKHTEKNPIAPANLFNPCCGDTIFLASVMRSGERWSGVLQFSVNAIRTPVCLDDLRQVSLRSSSRVGCYDVNDDDGYPDVEKEVAFLGVGAGKNGAEDARVLYMIAVHKLAQLRAMRRKCFGMAFYICMESFGRSMSAC